VGTVGAKIEVPKRVGCGEGVLGRGLCPSPENFRFWISNRRILAQTGCFLRSSPKAGLNAVLVRRRPNCQTLSIFMPMNDLLLLLFGLPNCCCLCSRGSCLPSLINCLLYNFVNLLCATDRHCCLLPSVADSNTDSDSALCRPHELLCLCNNGV